MKKKPVKNELKHTNTVLEHCYLETSIFFMKWATEVIYAVNRPVPIIAKNSLLEGSSQAWHNSA